MYDRKKSVLLTIDVLELSPPMEKYPKFLRKYHKLRKYSWFLRKKGWQDLQIYMSPEGGPPSEDDFKVWWFREDDKKRKEAQKAQLENWTRKYRMGLIPIPEHIKIIWS